MMISLADTTTKSFDAAILSIGRAVIDTEIKAIEALKGRIDEHFVAACEIMLNCSGRIIVIGMGKSGHIGNKIAATLASTGSPAFFVHPGEASHGDLGMIKQNDVILLLSNSGQTDELITILPVLKRLNLPLIALTGNPKSALAKNATVHLDVSVEYEACPLGLAPTSSTTTALVMGDALAISLLQKRGFSKEDFARSHPAGQLGRRLLVHISDVMHTDNEVPCILGDAFVSDAIVEMTQKRLGMTAVVDSERRLLGVFTDGDLRRALDECLALNTTRVKHVMSTQVKTIRPDQLAVDAAHIMQSFKITGLLVIDADKRVVGALNIHDLLHARVL